MSILKELFSTLNEKKVNDDQYFVVIRAGSSTDLFTERAFPSFEAARKFVRSTLSALQNDRDSDTDAADEEAEELEDADIMSGAQLKKSYPHLFEAVKDDCVANQCHAQAVEKSKKEGVVQHVNKDKKTGKLYVSDWFDDDETVASYNKGKKINESLNKKKEGEKLFLVKSRKKNQQVKVYAKDEVQARDRVAVHDNNFWFTGPKGTDVTVEIVKEVQDSKGREIKAGDRLVWVDGNGEHTGTVSADPKYNGGLKVAGRSVKNIVDDADKVTVLKEARSIPSWFKDGAKVKLMPEYADKDPNEVFTLGSVDTETGKGRIADTQGKGWGISYYQVYPKNKTPAIHEEVEGNQTFTKKDDGKVGRYGVKVGQVYVPADGSKNELKVLSINHASEDALVFDKVQNKERHIDLFKLAKVRYSLKEDADLAKQLVRGEKSPKGLMAKLDHWLMKLMIEKDGNRFLPAETAVKALKSYGFSGDQVHKIREAAAEAAQTAVTRMQKKHGDRVPAKYISTMGSSFAVYDLFLNIGEDLHAEFAALMRQLFDAKIDKIKDELVIVKEDAALQGLGKSLAGKSPAAPSDGVDVPMGDAGTDEPVAPPSDTEVKGDADDASTPAEFKVGDVVKTLVGPHKGQEHDVTKVYPDGRMDLKPKGLEGTAVKYRNGGVTAKPDQVVLAESIVRGTKSLLRTITIDLTEAAAKDGIMPLSYRPAKGHKIEAYGRKGMKNTMWRKFFKDSDAMSKWCEDNDATVEGSRDLEKDELK